MTLAPIYRRFTASYLVLRSPAEDDEAPRVRYKMHTTATCVDDLNLFICAFPHELSARSKYSSTTAKTCRHRHVAAEVYYTGSVLVTLPRNVDHYSRQATHDAQLSTLHRHCCFIPLSPFLFPVRSFDSVKALSSFILDSEFRKKNTGNRCTAEMLESIVVGAA